MRLNSFHPDVRQLLLGMGSNKVLVDSSVQLQQMMYN